ncbi:aminoglycoside adenylyltransferase domain-containing protein [Cytobacillus dafuensis]|uniref:DUF4111 domain-containing protein n=1 Tax=Cytobacillus dafuensis TaxID=1742359 RepID=A0A5B8Z868_CYTDA|nr:aminoglycoside adenylyltransferase domain-containing protein [Cytobacillus dafuensis]QED49272.1 DUF4111 domain-containing protein [Cytobacillus dafuensis]
MSNIPNNIKLVIDSYFVLLDSKLPNILDAYYIYGSISLGAFTEGFSDIDFIAILQRKLTNIEIVELTEVHKEIQKRFPKMILDGIYVMQSDFESLRNQNSCLEFREGKFQGYTQFNRNSIDAFQLKKYGIAIKGRATEELNYTVNWDELLNGMHNNLNTYWKDWKNKCEKFPSIHYAGLFFSLSSIEWGVLGVSRPYYTFLEKDITSKVEAGEYALRTVPPRWHKIINESMRLRKGITQSYYTSRNERRNDALLYMDFILQESNKLFSDANIK